MESNDRTWMIPKTTKLIPLDIAFPKTATTLPSGLTVTFKDPENIDPDAIERYVDIYRTVCFGTQWEIFGFACIINALLVSPLLTADVEQNRRDLHTLFVPILDSIDDRKWGSRMVTRPYDELEHENSIFAMFWRCWGIAVRSAIAQGKIDDRVPLREMSNLLIEYAGSPTVIYKRPGRPEGELIALPVWVRNWFHHTENTLEPTPPSRHEIRKAATDLIRLSFAVEMTEGARRKDTSREQIGDTTLIEYDWLHMQVYVNEKRNEIRVCQLGVFNGWRVQETYSNYRNSGEELVDFALKLKQQAMSQS